MAKVFYFDKESASGIKDTYIFVKIQYFPS